MKKGQDDSVSTLTPQLTLIEPELKLASSNFTLAGTTAEALELTFRYVLELVAEKNSQLPFANLAKFCSAYFLEAASWTAVG